MVCTFDANNCEMHNYRKKLFGHMAWLPWFASFSIWNAKTTKLADGKKSGEVKISLGFKINIKIDSKPKHKPVLKTKNQWSHFLCDLELRVKETSHGNGSEVVAGQYQWEVAGWVGKRGWSLGWWVGEGGQAWGVTGGQSQVLAKSGEY